MNFPFEIEDIELIWGSADVSFFVPVSLEDSIDLTYHHIVSDIEFALTVQERTVDVELHNESFISSIVMLPFTLHYWVQLIDLVNYSDAIASVGEFSWLYDPNIPHWSANWNAILFVLFLLVDDGLSLLVVDCESLILWITIAFLDMEGQGNNFEEISSCQLVVLF